VYDVLVMAIRLGSLVEIGLVWVGLCGSILKLAGMVVGEVPDQRYEGEVVRVRSFATGVLGVVVTPVGVASRCNSIAGASLSLSLSLGRAAAL
jgi:hypothetical protein